MENRLPLRISLPFVAGVACGGVCCATFRGISAGISAEVPVVLATGLVVALCLAGLAFSRRHDRVLLYLMLFALGVFCYCLRAADLLAVTPGLRCPIGVGHDGSGVIAGGDRLSCLMDRLRALIDGAGFADERTAPLLRALMTGDRSGLDRQTVSAFRLSGASHLLALSGLHMGVIAMFVRRVLMVLGNSRPAEIVRSVLLVGFCLTYTLACGASPSLVRAFLFILLGQIAALSPNRRSPLSDRLCIAATIQLAFDPLAIGSIAFQLSYLAMIGIVFIAPRLEAWYPSTRLSERIDPFRWIWKAASLAISCQLTTAPLVWLRFGNFPHYFLLTNLLAMPVCELLLPVAIITLLLGSPALLVRLTDWLASTLLDNLQIIAVL